MERLQSDCTSDGDDCTDVERLMSLARGTAEETGGTDEAESVGSKRDGGGNTSLQSDATSPTSSRKAKPLGPTL